MHKIPPYDLQGKIGQNALTAKKFIVWQKTIENSKVSQVISDAEELINFTVVWELKKICQKKTK